MALAVPLRSTAGESPLEQLERALHPWVAYLVTPLFGFANAGVSIAGMTAAALADGVSLGIAAGLFFGKQIGVFGAVFVCVRLGIARLPEGATWLSLYGVSMLAGIGFTMSLFIGTLAWDTAAYAASLRIGVLAGSILSGLAGYALLLVAGRSAPVDS
jgi:NhaA family Na+:H+ antiporter